MVGGVKAMILLLVLVGGCKGTESTPPSSWWTPPPSLGGPPDQDTFSIYKCEVCGKNGLTYKAMEQHVFNHVNSSKFTHPNGNNDKKIEGVIKTVPLFFRRTVP